MNDDLQRVLRGRADRAPVPHDVDHTVDLVATGAEHHTRRRRNRLAVASGAAVVVAAATVGVAVVDGGAGNPAGPGTTRSVAAGGAHSSARPGGVAVRSQGRWVHHYVDPLTGPHVQVSTTDQLSAKEKRQLQAALRANRLREARQAVAAQKLAAEARNAGGSLTPVDPAPKKAEISLGLVPKGFGYLSYESPLTYYGLPGTPPDDYVADGIVVDVHQFSGGTKDFTLTVNGKPASYGVSGGSTVVRVLYGKHVDIGFQAPPSARLTRAQALKMAASLDVRSTENRVNG